MEGQRGWAVRLSAALFFYWAGVSVMVGFLATVLRHMGYSATQNGRIASAVALGTLLLQPTLGYLGDRTAPPRRLLMLCLTAGLPLGMYLPFLGRGWALSAGVVALSLLCEPQATLFDSLILRSRAHSPELDYGKIRSWGPLGSALGALAAGAMGLILPLSWLYALVAVFFGMGLLLLRSLGREEERMAADAPGPLAALGELIKNPAYVLFVACCGLYQFSMRTATTFLGLIMADRGGGSLELGLLLGVVYAGQLPFMRWAGRRLDGGMGCPSLFGLSMLLGVVRLGLLAVSLPFGLVLVTQLLQAAQTGLYTRIFVPHMADITPPALQATAAGLGAALSLGMGQIVGGLVHGALIEAAGPSASAWLSAGVMATTYLLYRLLEPRTRPERT